MFKLVVIREVLMETTVRYDLTHIKFAKHLDLHRGTLVF